MSHISKAPREHFVVVYADSGIRPDERWVITVAYPSGSQADRIASDLRCKGFKALVKQVGEVVDHGPPVG